MLRTGFRRGVCLLARVVLTLCVGALVVPAAARADLVPEPGSGSWTWTYTTDNVNYNYTSLETISTSFSEVQIEPGEAFSVHQDRDYQHKFLYGSCVPPEVTEDTTNELTAFVFLHVPPKGTFMTLGPEAYDLTFDGSGTLHVVQGMRCDGTRVDYDIRTLDFTVPGSATEGMPEGCYELYERQHYDEELAGAVATIAIGVPASGCSAVKECADGMSNDFDGLVDYPLDPGCTSAADDSELGSAECDNGVNDDGDAFTDWPMDTGCDNALDDREASSKCSDGVDNDADRRTDFPADPGCSSATDTSEDPDPACGDGYTNDRDDLADYPLDPGCTSSRDDSEYDEVTLTTDVDGPGTLRGCSRHCTYSVERGSPLVLDAVAAEPIDGLRRVDGCDVALVGRCELRMNDSRTVAATFDPVVSYAPAVRLSKGEKYFPMDPGKFVAHSKLKWHSQHGFYCPASKQRSCVAAKPCRGDSATLAKLGRVNALALGQGGYRKRQCWTQAARPRVGGPAKYRATWTSSNFTTPSRTPGTPASRGAPVGRSGMVLDLDNGYRSGSKPVNGVGPPLYYEFVPGRYIVYWLFYGNNHAGSGPIKDHHEGDWEHIVVRLDEHNQALAVNYYAHYCTSGLLTWAQMLRREGQLVGGVHPAVWVAKGSHASYPDAGYDLVAGKCVNGLKKGMSDHRTKGKLWQTWKQGLGGFKNAALQPWYGFGGSWGDIADSSKHYPGPFWGPLGPGRLKLDLQDAVPQDWR